MFLGMLGWHKHEFAPGTLFHGPIISFGYLERVVVAIQRERVEKGPQNFWMMEYNEQMPDFLLSKIQKKNIFVGLLEHLRWHTIFLL